MLGRKLQRRVKQRLDSLPVLRVYDLWQDDSPSAPETSQLSCDFLV
jgi:hypothetical protein